MADLSEGYVPFPAFAEWTVAFDPTVVDQYAARLARVRAAATPEARQRALEIATRTAAVDTGALEGLYETDRGFTETIATQSEFWQRALDQRDERTKRSIEDALAAYDYVMPATTGQAPITAKWIRDLHAIITAHQETHEVVVRLGHAERRECRPLRHGAYKEFPNNPTSLTTGRTHFYAPPESTSAEVLRLTDQLASPEFNAAHPVVQSAYAHYAYVCIHPFADGNGRVARALASVFLYRNPGVPLVIFADQRGQYISALETADEGNAAPFVGFIVDRVVDAIGLVAQSLVNGRSPGHVMADIAVALLPEKVTLAAHRLISTCLDHIGQVVGQLNLAPGMALGVSRTADATESSPVPGQYAVPQVDHGNALLLSVSLDGAWCPVRHVYTVFSTAATDRPTFLVAGPTQDLEVWLREIDPLLSASLDLRLSMWAETAVSHFLEELSEKNSLVAMRDSTCTPDMGRKDML